MFADRYSKEEVTDAAESETKKRPEASLRGSLRRVTGSGGPSVCINEIRNLLSSLENFTWLKC